MPQNIGRPEQIIRILVGATLLALGFLHVVAGTLAIVVYVAGGVLLVTSFFRFCPAWAIFGINTCASNRAHAR